MKPIEEFTQDILQKQKRLKKKKRIIRSSVALSLVGLLTFGVVYSNIIPFGELFESRAYERYMQSYVSSDQNTRLKIIDGDNAAITVGNRAYACALKEENAQTFSLSVHSEEIENENLSVRFSDGRAELSGKLNGENIGKTLNIVQDMEVENGAWTHFESRQYENGTRGAIFDWLLVDETQSYCGNEAYALECEFVAVGDIVLQYVKDQVSGIYTALLFETVSTTVYGFPVVSVTGYLNADGSEWITSYFKQIDEKERLDFSGGTFETELIDYELTSRYYDALDMSGGSGLEGGIGWRLMPLSPIAKTRSKDLKLSLHLNADGSLSFRSSGHWLLNMSCGGKWIAFEDFLLVILDKEYPYLGLKSFTIKQNESTFLQGDFLQTAVSQIGTAGVYKVGYHTFTYYYYNAEAMVYWGSEWSEDTIKPKLLYDVVYAFDGWFEDWHAQNSKGERVPLVEDNGTELIFRENGKCEVYRNGELKQTIGYRFNVINEENFSVRFDSRLYVYCEGERYSTYYLNVYAKRLFAQTEEYAYVNDVFSTRGWQIAFRTR
ncbi:MAG: hypothetical protein J6B56_05945 [Clostridia bacterium]|nr:hypothetical protein [Clostridia bacterium]